jgi:allophanate hydrolase subunit 2
MDRIGQIQPHSEARFVPVDMQTALRARADRKAHLERIRQALSR